MAGFDVAKARKDGYSDQEIVKFLETPESGFDLAKARKDGYSDQEVLEYLAGGRKENDGIPLIPTQIPGKTPAERARAIKADPKLQAQNTAAYRETLGGSGLTDGPDTPPEGSGLGRLVTGLVSPVVGAASDIYQYLRSPRDWSQSKGPGDFGTPPPIPMVGAAGKAASGDVLGAVGTAAGDIALAKMLTRPPVRTGLPAKTSIPAPPTAVSSSPNSFLDLAAGAISPRTYFGLKTARAGVGAAAGPISKAAGVVGEAVESGRNAIGDILHPLELTPEQQRISLAHVAAKSELEPTPVEIPRFRSRVQWQTPSGREPGTGEPKASAPRQINPTQQAIVDIHKEFKPELTTTPTKPVEMAPAPSSTLGLRSGRVPGSGEPKPPAARPPLDASRAQATEFIKGAGQAIREEPQAEGSRTPLALAPKPDKPPTLPSGRVPGSPKERTEPRNPLMNPDLLKAKPGDIKVEGGPIPTAPAKEPNAIIAKKAKVERKPAKVETPKEIEATPEKIETPKVEPDDYDKFFAALPKEKNMAANARAKDVAIVKYFKENGIQHEGKDISFEDFKALETPQQKVIVKKVNPKYDWRGDKTRLGHLEALWNKEKDK